MTTPTGPAVTVTTEHATYTGTLFHDSTTFIGVELAEPLYDVYRTVMIPTDTILDIRFPHMTLTEES